MSLYKGVIDLIRRNRESFSIGILTNILSSGVVALLVVRVFRIPKLDLHLDFMPGHTKGIYRQLPVLDVSVVNKKWWIGFGPEEVQFGLFLPTKFFNLKKMMYLKTSDEGELDWTHHLRGKLKFPINGEEYYLFRHVVHLAVHPQSRVHFLRLAGDFEKNQAVEIYYYFDTPYGRVPHQLKFGERVKSATEGKLPHKNIRF